MERSDRARRRVHPADTGPRAGRTVAIASLLLSSSSCTPTIAVSLPEPPATAKSMLIDVEGPGSGSVLALAVDGPFSLAVAMLEPQAIAVAYYGATLVASFGRSIREGFMASCTTSVARLTGRRPRTLRETLAPLLRR